MTHYSNDSKTPEKSSLHSISSHKDRKYDTIQFRQEFIKGLLHDKIVDPMVNFNICDTENFICPNSNTKNRSTNDIRKIFNKKNYNFYNVIEQIGGKLIYIKSGTTGHTFKGIIPPEDGVSFNYAVKVVAYPKKQRYGNMHDARRPENAELRMISVLSYFVINRRTLHIILPICSFNTSIKPFVNLIEANVVDKDNKKYNEFVERYKKGEYNETVSILFTEWANRGDILDFIRKNYKEFTLKEWKIIFFQILSVLAVIQDKYPSFRHNDLKANNILIHKKNKRKNGKFVYTICKTKYVIPDIGYQIKLCDFDFACIPGIVNNSKVSAKWTDEINVKPEQNRYYDMHYFFNTLIKRGFFHQFMEVDGYVHKDAQDFVNRIVPSIYQRGDKVSKRGRLLVNHEFTTPDDTLKNDVFFAEFR